MQPLRTLTTTAASIHRVWIGRASCLPPRSGIFFSFPCHRQRRLWSQLPLLLSSRYLLRYIVAHRDEEAGDERVGQHTADHDGTEYPPPRRARTRRGPQRHAAQDERERSHKEWAPPQTHAFQRGVHQALSPLEGEGRELDNQDGVLGGESDEHDQTDLRIHVHAIVAQPDSGEGAEDRDRYC